MRPVKPPIPFRVALVLFVLSGATSLVDQVVWLRYLTFVFGNTTLATATLLAVFMGGLAAGAAFWGRRAARLRTDPVMLYAAFEAFIGIHAVLSPLLCGLMDDVWVAVAAGAPAPVVALLRVLLGGLFLVPPTFLMGGTLPILARAFEEEGDRRGRSSGLLYAWNTAGAFAGTLLATDLLIPSLGLRQTLGVSAAANFAIVAVALLLRRRGGELAPESAPSIPPPPAAGRWLALFFAIGFASLGYEVVWTRILVFYLGSSVYAFGTMLAVILLGLAAGSALASMALPRLRRPALALGLLELGVVAGVAAQFLLIPNQGDRMVAIASLFPTVNAATHATTLFVSTLLLLAVPTLCMGAAFPIAIRLAAPTGEAGHGVGRVYAANTCGAIAGSLGAGFLLIPALGTQRALLGLAAVNAVVAALVLAAAVPRLLAAVAGLLALVPLLLLGAFVPRDRLVSGSGLLGGPGRPLLHFKEDASCAVSIVEFAAEEGRFKSIEVNGVNVAGSSPDLVAIQKLQGHLPLLVHGNAKKVVHIGFGSGGTAFAVTRHPIDRLQIAEISPAVLEASDEWFPEINHGVLRNPKTRIAIADGRNYLLASKEKFDVILSDSIHPRYAGNGSLYSEDWFRLCREHLAPGGVVSMWLPIYSLEEKNLREILRAFVEVFPAASVWYSSTTINPFLIVLGREDDRAVPVGRFVEGFHQPAVEAELREIGYPTPESLLGELVVSGNRLVRWVDGVEPHVDDLPTVEYESGRILSRTWSWMQCFASVLANASGPAPGLEARTPAEREVASAAVRVAISRQPLLLEHANVLRRWTLGEQAPTNGAATLPK